MQSQPKNKIASLLRDAYHQLGVNTVRELEERAKQALAYMEADREHYIEVADEDTPEYMISSKHGVICKLIPLAQEITHDKEHDHIRQHSMLFFLMVSDSGNRYVYSTSTARLYEDPSQNCYSFPVYHYVELKDVRKDLDICRPQQIRPIATALEWEAYGMMFCAFAQLEQSGVVNNVPRRTERAMQAHTYTKPQRLTIVGRSYLGKLVPLALAQSLWDELREDHQYGFKKELCLLVTPEKPYYILKTTHIYSYFRKVRCDDIPGGFNYEPTEEKQETTYEFVTLSDLPRDMCPLYH